MTSARFQGEHRKWWTLAAVALGLFMIMLDNTVVNVALPSMQKSLDLEISQLEWIVTGYTLTFGAFMLTGGKIADLFGRRRTFVAGLGIFTLSSLACGLADSAATLIWGRVVQGVGSALMNPATLSIIAVAFPPRERGHAIGIWVGVSALALAIGPVVGGVLAEHASWHWIFFINLPIGVIAIVAAFAFIDESQDTSLEQRADVPGLVTSGLGLFALTYGLIEANHFGWGSPRIVGVFSVAIISLAAFVALERHQRLPMLDLGLFRDRMFAGANAVMLLNSLAMFGVFFYVSLYMQQVLGFSPVKAGLMFLPMTVLIIMVAPRAGHLADRTGARLLVGVGQLLVAGALLLFAQMTAQSTAWSLVPPMMISGAGMAMTMTPATAAAMGSVRADKMGVGSAVLNSARQVGGSIGIALMGAVVASRSSPSHGQAGPAAFVHGMQGGFYVAAVIALAGSMVGIATLRKRKHIKPVAEAGTPSSLDEKAQGIPKNHPLSESNPNNAVI
jgi:EmrB/QacA subfamily drug resistance transporter